MWFFFFRIQDGALLVISTWRRTAVIYWPIFYFVLKVKIVSLARLVEHVMYFSFLFFFSSFRKIFETILLSGNVFNSSSSPFNGLEFKFRKFSSTQDFRHC